MHPPARLSPSLLAVALAAALAPAAWAQSTAAAATETKAEGSVAEGSISIGAGYISGDKQDRSLYDQYNGLNPGASGIGIFNADYYRRNEAAGTSVEFTATDLFTNNRELGFRYKKQGDWKFSADYKELRRNDPLSPNSGLVGSGSTTPQTAVVAPGLGSDNELKTQRKGLGLAVSKVISNQWTFDASISTEKKEGSRLSGIGMACPSAIAPGCTGTTATQVGSAVLYMPEPVDANHSQIEARMNYAGEKLRVSGGYYGSFYRNELSNMDPTIPGSLYNPVGTLLPVSAGLRGILGNPVALPPDNQSQQLDLTGTYSVDKTTLLNFKLAYSLATQTQGFAGSGFTAPTGVNDLGGHVATSLALVGFTTRPSPKLSINGNLRYEHKSDTTPLAAYNVEGTFPSTNSQFSRTDTKGKLEGAYQFDGDLRGTVGVDFQSIDRGDYTGSAGVRGVTALRQKTDEMGIRAELRKRMNEEFSGAVTLESSKRDGSSWLAANSTTGVTEVADPATAGPFFSSGVFMPTLADRQRDKVKLRGDWQPNEKLSLQGVIELGKDRFSSPSNYGLHSSGLNTISLDATYAINDKWNLTGFISYGEQELDQSRADAAIIAYRNKSNTFGVGFSGKPTAQIEVGGNFSFIKDHSTYDQTLDGAVGANTALLNATGGLPDVGFTQAVLKLFGKYTIDKQSAVRLDIQYWRSKWNDWAWNYGGVPFTYSDGSTVNRKDTQNVGYIGLTYVRRFP